MLEALPLGAALSWWHGEVFGGSDQEGAFPPFLEASRRSLASRRSQAAEGLPHQDGCRCPDCDPEAHAAMLHELEQEKP